MIIVLYSEMWEDRLVVRDYLVSRFGMTPVEADRAGRNLDRMTKEPLTNYVVWDCLTEIDVEGLEYAGAHSIFISRGPDENRHYDFTVNNTHDLAFVRHQVMDAVIRFSELTGKMSVALRRGLEKSMNENM
jgi:hypothetical protein